jgi:hypothetical protein
MFRFSRPDAVEITDVGRLEEIKPAVRASERGRHHAERDHCTAGPGVGLNLAGAFACFPDTRSA